MNDKIGLNVYIKNVEKTAQRFPTLLPRSTHLLTWMLLRLLKHLFGSEDHFYRELSSKEGIMPEWQFVLNHLYVSGIIESPFILQDENTVSDPDMFFYHIRARNNPNQTDGYQTSLLYSHAASFIFSKSCGRVIGEFLERYFLSLFKISDFTRGSLKHLENSELSCIDPSLLSEVIDWDSNSMLNWVKCKKLSDHSSILIPAQLIFWNYCYQDNLVEPFLREANSNGGAGSFILEEALLRGIYELIERDAFFVFWQNKISPQQIDLNVCKNEKLQTILEECRKKQLQVNICDITSDFGLPVFAAVVSGTNVHMGIGVGTAAGTNSYNVMIKALEEALAVRHWMESKHNELNRIKKLESGEYKTKMERASFWSTKDAVEHIEFFLRGGMKEVDELVEWEGLNIKMQLEKIQKLLVARGHAFEGYYYDASSEILDALGYKVVKVIIPGLIPLVVGSASPLDSIRRKDVAKVLGYSFPTIVNHLPHPLF